MIKIVAENPNWFRFPDGALVNRIGKDKFECDCDQDWARFSGREQVCCWHIRELRRRLGLNDWKKDHKGKIWR